MDFNENPDLDNYLLLVNIAKYFFEDVWEHWEDQMIIEPKIHGSGWYNIVQFIDNEISWNDVTPTLHELIREPLKNYILNFKKL